jgi:hypothetical protein
MLSFSLRFQWLPRHGYRGVRSGRVHRSVCMRQSTKGVEVCEYCTMLYTNAKESRSEGKDHLWRSRSGRESPGNGTFFRSHLPGGYSKEVTPLDCCKETKDAGRMQCASNHYLQARASATFVSTSGEEGNEGSTSALRKQRTSSWWTLTTLRSRRHKRAVGRRGLGCLANAAQNRPLPCVWRLAAGSRFPVPAALCRHDSPTAAECDGTRGWLSTLREMTAVAALSAACN